MVILSKKNDSSIVEDEKIEFFNELLVFIFISALTLIDERRVIGHLITGFLRKVRIVDCSSSQ